MCPVEERLDDDDRVLRRVLPEHVRGSDCEVAPQAFRPHKERDAAGLSLFLASVRTPEEVAVRTNGESAFVVVLRVAAIRSLGLEVVLDDPESGHCLIPALNARDRKSDRSLEWQEKLASKQVREAVLGPFPRLDDPSDGQ